MHTFGYGYIKAVYISAYSLWKSRDATMIVVLINYQFNSYLTMYPQKEQLHFCFFCSPGSYTPRGARHSTTQRAIDACDFRLLLAPSADLPCSASVQHRDGDGAYSSSYFYHNDRISSMMLGCVCLSTGIVSRQGVVNEQKVRRGGHSPGPGGVGVEISVGLLSWGEQYK